MIQKCRVCGKEYEGRANKHYCSPKCRKSAEVSLRRAPKKNATNKKHQTPTTAISGIPISFVCPDYLDCDASDYWNKVAPLLIKRGHLNHLSEDAFVELCDIHSRLRGINRAINETNRSLLQIDDKWDNKTGVETQSFKESALSDIKRKYSKLFLDYQKQFYLTPLPNRGNFGIQEDEKDPLDEFIKGQNGK